MPIHPDLAHDEMYDALVVGGGINGAGIARDLAGRGYRVLLVERDDLAAHTSSASTKLIHGGLRYLEQREFRLVRKALQERELLLRSAPHIMWPLRFVLPHEPGMRPAWLIRTGLWLYDHLAHRALLPPSRAINLRQHPAGRALQPRLQRGFEYSDGWVDDARLVVLAAVDAQARGATVCTRTACIAAQRQAKHWTVTLQGALGAQQPVQVQVQTRVLVNAAGPWAEQFLRQVAQPAQGESPVRHHLRLVKGSHIVVARRFEGEHAYLFQSRDGRVVFALPYERDFTLIGTTDVEVHGDPGRAATIDAQEIDYLCAQASRYLRQPVNPAQVVWHYSGVRPLLDDHTGSASAITRDYLLERHEEAAPLLTVWGGKITTFRRLAEEAADQVGRWLGPPRPAWTASASLPGGDLSAWIGPAVHPQQDFARFVQALQAQHAWLPAALAQRWARAYGSRVAEVLGPAHSLAELGREVAPGLWEAELHYLRQHEWAHTAEDVLWRRSKLGLHYSPAQQQAVAQWLR